MTIKYAIQEAVPEALVWLDQDARDKTAEGALVVEWRTYCGTEGAKLIKELSIDSLLIAAGMADGVATSRFFVLYLTEGVFSRKFCQLEIKKVRTMTFLSPPLSCSCGQSIQCGKRLPDFGAPAFIPASRVWLALPSSHRVLRVCCRTTPCPSARPQAISAARPIVLVRETDSRQGAARGFESSSSPGAPRGGAPPLPVIRCSRCQAPATQGAQGAAWPSLCAEHKAEGMVPCGVNRGRVRDDALSFSLIFDGAGATAFIDPDALELATQILGGNNPSGAGGPSRHPLVVADIRWCFPELEFRKLSLAQLLAAVGMRKAAGAPPNGALPLAASAAVGTASAATQQAAQTPPPQAAEAPAETATLRDTLERLAMGVAAPPLPGDCKHHVCIVHDPACAAADSVCRALALALTSAFAGAKVFLAGEDPRELAQAAAASACVVPFVTRGLLRSGAAAATAVAAALRNRRRLVVPYEFEWSRGGSPSVQDLIGETAPEANGLWAYTAFPWLGGGGEGADHDAEATAVCVLRLVLDGVMDEASRDCKADPMADNPGVNTTAGTPSSAGAPPAANGGGAGSSSTTPIDATQAAAHSQQLLGGGGPTDAAGGGAQTEMTHLSAAAPDPQVLLLLKQVEAAVKKRDRSAAAGKLREFISMAVQKAFEVGGASLATSMRGVSTAVQGAIESAICSMPGAAAVDSQLQMAEKATMIKQGGAYGPPREGVPLAAKADAPAAALEAAAAAAGTGLAAAKSFRQQRRNENP